jgi:hypothetical protein
MKRIWKEYGKNMERIWKEYLSNSAFQLRCVSKRSTTLGSASTKMARGQRRLSPPRLLDEKNSGPVAV